MSNENSEVELMIQTLIYTVYDLNKCYQKNSGNCFRHFEVLLEHLITYRIDSLSGAIRSVQSECISQEADLAK